ADRVAESAGDVVAVVQGGDTALEADFGPPQAEAAADRLHVRDDLQGVGHVLEVGQLIHGGCSRLGRRQVQAVGDVGGVLQLQGRRAKVKGAGGLNAKRRQRGQNLFP